MQSLSVTGLSFVLLFVLVFASTVEVIIAQPATGPVAYFDYSMQERFGMDRNRDEIIDYDYSREYIHPSSGYAVTFDGCKSSTGGQSRLVSFEWSIEGNGLSIARSEDVCKTTEPINLPIGFYSVTLTIANENGQTTSITERIAIKDLLIVSIGDSLASGEGNPEKNAEWVTTPRPRVIKEAVWQDSRCHRSTEAYSAQAALNVERADPHTSVTFLHFACSGAGIPEGLVGWYDGIEPPTDHDLHELIQPQIWQVTRAICLSATDSNDPTCLQNGRKVDILIISIGINDIGFGDIVEACAILPSCDTDTVVNSDLNAGFAKLPESYKQLADDIARRFPVADIMITEYPDPTHNKDGNFCTTFGGALTGITEKEAKWASERVVSRLNKLIQDVANMQGWIPAVGMAEMFRTHGYCSGDNRWFRTTEDSLAMQGNVAGSLHPSVLGHQMAYRNTILPLILIHSATPQIVATIEPNSIKSKVPTTFIVHAEDSKTHEPVEGVVIISNKQVGTTDTPFTYTYDASLSRLGIVKVSSPNYPDKHLLLGVEIEEPVTRADPRIIPLGREISVTIYATDSNTGEDVTGSVLTDAGISNNTIGETNRPFTHTFTKKVIVEADDEGNRSLIRVNPTISVVAPGYATTNVTITFTGGIR